MKKSYRTSIYYEDTDCMGIVYHASYVRFLERARTELLDSAGFNAAEWMSKGTMFPVYRLELVYKTPAKLRDTIEVLSEVRAESAYRLCFKQTVTRPATNEVLVTATAEIVCTNREGKLRELPDEMVERLASSGTKQDQPAVSLS